MTLHLFQIRSRLLSAIAIGFANAILAESSQVLGPVCRPSFRKECWDAQGFLFSLGMPFPGVLSYCCFGILLATV